MGLSIEKWRNGDKRFVVKTAYFTRFKLKILKKRFGKVGYVLDSGSFRMRLVFLGL